MPEEGSAVIFALFVCVAVAVAIQALTVAAVCGARALADEARGRGRLAAIDGGLRALRDTTLKVWSPTSWAPVGSAPETLAGRLVQLEEALGWVLRAEVSESLTSPHAVTSAFIERGRDGLDLPHAALVADRVAAAEGRVAPWLMTEGAVDGGEAASPGGPTIATGPEMSAQLTAQGAQAASEWIPGVGYANRVSCLPLLAPGCSLERLPMPWGLGEGWKELLKAGLASGPRVVLLEGQKGELLSVPTGLDMSSRERPVLVVVTGGADLDLRGSGDVWGVVGIDDGSVLLEQTVVHGAVYVGDSVDFGWSGGVVFTSDVWRWATDGSFTRARLVPCTRQEDIE